MIAAPLVIEPEADRVVRLLEALGDTTLDVARRLLELGVTGHRGRSYSCPLANYLGVNGVKADVYPSIGDRDQAAHVDFNGNRVLLGTALDEFVDQFDSGLFPELVSP